MIVKAIKTKIFKEGDNLLDFIIEHVKKIPEQSVLIVTSKIVSLAEGRVVEYQGEEAKTELIKSESDLAIPTKYVWLTVKDNMVMASAGIDDSNANGKLILLPRDSFKAAASLCIKLKNKFKLKHFGVVITDSRTIPLRAGTIGVSLGYAGLQGLKQYRGQRDLFGRKFQFARVSVVDSLAAAAVLEMGEGNECQPLALIKEASIKFQERINRQELDINLEEDMYAPFFAQAKS
jgi:coenzyme F420-0:L-glutamate ligase